MEAVTALPSWQSWIAGAKAEPWHMARYDALVDQAASAAVTLVQASDILRPARASVLRMESVSQRGRSGAA